MPPQPTPHQCFVREIILERDKVPSFSEYPYSLSAVSKLHSLELHPSVTFVVGENGSGKSTLLEAISVAWGFNPEGGSRNFNFHSRESHSPLHAALRLSKSPKRPSDGYFLRAESFYNVATEIEELDKIMTPLPQPPVIDSYGGLSLHEQSHGESFFALITERFGGNGLYILDEPEAALSPARQLAMISRISDLVKQNSQFIIATHSPIIMAYPDSWIYQINDSGLERVAYEQTEHFTLTRQFLNNPKSMLNILLED